MDNSKELQTRIEKLRAEIADIADNRPQKVNSPVEVARLQSEIYVASSQLAEISSRRLERQTDTLIALTKWLCGLTVVLIFFGIFDFTEIILKLAERFCQAH